MTKHTVLVVKHISKRTVIHKLLNDNYLQKNNEPLYTRVNFKPMRNFFTISIMIMFVLLNGCTNSSQENQSNSLKELDKQIGDSIVEMPRIIPKTRGENIIFYNMFSPLDMDKILDEKSSYFNSAYINALNNITKYTTSQKIALNIGVYGADLSYLWIFDQNQQALSYLTAIKHLTDKLGIPDNLVEVTTSYAKQNSTEMDSLIIIARNSYFATDTYLKESERENYALLILLGGWVETMYVALKMYNETDSKLASKIITQKYSLTSLITMAQNHPDDIVLSEYLLLMKKMSDAFKLPESQLKPEDVEIDTVNKRIIIKDSGRTSIEPNHFAELKAITSQIRNRIIE